MNTETKDQLIEYLKINGPAGPSQIAYALNISPQMAHRHIKDLTASGEIIKSGTSPKVKYKVNEIKNKIYTNKKCYEFILNSKIEGLLSISQKLQSEINKINNPQTKQIIQKKLKIDWTYESNAIEGSTLSYGDTLFFIEQGLTVEGKPFKDFLDAKNHVQAIDFIFDVISTKREINSGLIKEINALLLHGVKETKAITQEGQKTKKPAHPGQYKKLPNHVLKVDGTIHKYVKPIQVSSQMEQLCSWIKKTNNENLNPIIISAIAHYNFVRIHPFDDGNGRGARILMNLILIKNNISPAIVKNENRREYFNLLSQADSGDLTPFITFIANQVIKTQETIISATKNI